MHVIVISHEKHITNPNSSKFQVQMDQVGVSLSKHPAQRMMSCQNLCQACDPQSGCLFKRSNVVTQFGTMILICKVWFQLKPQYV